MLDSNLNVLIVDEEVSSEFKRKAVELVTRSDQSMAEVERELGLSEGLLKRWVRKAKQDGEAAFPGHGRSVRTTPGGSVGRAVVSRRTSS